MTLDSNGEVTTSPPRSKGNGIFQGMHKNMNCEMAFDFEIHSKCLCCAIWSCRLSWKFLSGIARDLT